jgi:CelD/BcsL family acetyltransferase involved in cellulose biosynthesis
MKHRVITPSELDSGLLGEWKRISQSRFFYNRPYYQPEWVKLIDSVRGDARIAIIEDAGQVIGFLPFQLQSINRNPAIGMSLADYQGPIYSKDCNVPTSVWLAASGHRYWQYDHMPCDLSEFEPHAWTIKHSQWMNMQGGYESYCNRLSERNDGAKSRIIKDAEVQQRKITREYPDVNFEFDNRSASDFLSFIKGKSFQYVNTLGADHDMFRVEWINKTINYLFQMDPHSSLRGRFSSLKIGDRLIAGSFGAECNGVLQFNILWYDPEFSRFSPGTQVLHACAKQSFNAGIHTLELGGGAYDYKAKFRTDTMPTMAGAISNPAILSKTHATYLKLRWRLRDSKFGKKLRKFM